MSAAQQDAAAHYDTGSFKTAIAQTATRGLALYFSRPVRLFRPSKVSGWQSLKALAMKQGTSVTPQYLLSLVKLQGILILPKHFIPPMMINACLGTVLWTSYAKAYILIEPRLANSPIFAAGLAGAAAGGLQALVAAPAENVRVLMEGKTGGHSWSSAWKEVFRNAALTESSAISKQQHYKELRELRSWMKEVGDMAGRGWDGWGWGCAKDICAFAAFFSIFDITRRIGSAAKTSTQDILNNSVYSARNDALERHLPRMVNSILLVTGGVIAGLAYDFVSRPWDFARRTIHIEKFTHSTGEHVSIMATLISKVQQTGVRAVFFGPQSYSSSSVSGSGAKIHRLLRTLSRVGPWGVGFLVWEAYGPALS